MVWFFIGKAKCHTFLLNSLFSFIELQCHCHHTSNSHIHLELFLGTLFYRSLCLARHQYHIVLITSAFKWVLVSVRDLLFLFLVLCSSLWILESVYILSEKISLEYLVELHSSIDLYGEIVFMMFLSQFIPFRTYSFLWPLVFLHKYLWMSFLSFFSWVLYNFSFIVDAFFLKIYNFK